MVAQPRPDADFLVGATGDDKELTLAFQRGDNGAYQTIHDRYSQRVHAISRRMLVNPDDAAEAAQETFLRVYQGLGRFNGRYQLNAWITRIATNVCLDQLRARGRRPDGLTPFENEDLNTPCESSDLPEEIAVRRSETRRVRKVLRSLPPMHRAAIVLRDFEGLSYAEVAQALEISEAQVKALLHRARQRFKRNWSESLAALLPARLAQRFRGDHVARDHSVLGSASQLAPTCSSVMQQCGQYVMDKLAPVMTVAVVASAAAAPAPASHAPPPPEPIAAREEAPPQVEGTRYRRPRNQDVAEEPEQLAPSVAPETTDEPPSATPTPSPTETPAPSDGSSDPDEASGGTGGTAEPSPSPTPTPFAPTVGFDWGRAIPALIPVAYVETVSCYPLEVDQYLVTAVDDDDSPVRYEAALDLVAHTIPGQGDAVTVRFDVWKHSNEVSYRGWGRLVTKQAVGGDLLEVIYSGNYETHYAGASSLDLPQNGRFDVSLTLDCAAHSVVTEKVVFRR